MFKVKHLSLRFSLGSSFVGIVILTAIGFGLATFINVRSFVRQDIKMRIHDIVGTAAGQIDGDSHNKIKTRDDERGRQYSDVKKQLQNIRDRSTGVRFVYTMRREHSGKVVFVVDAEEKSGQISHVGDLYEQTTPMMMSAFEKPAEVKVENSFETDKWGSWLSGYAPILASDGSISGIVGLDISVQNILDYEQRYLIIILLSSILITALVVLLGVMFSRSISKPLLRLADDLENVRRFDLDTDIQVKSIVTEVLNMKTAIDNTKSGLRSFKKYVPADLVAELIQLGKEAVLGSENKDVTVFFSDIADFTAISEHLKPEELAEELRLYYEGMTAAVLKNHGTIDKYIGDSIMAFWGAPHPIEDHPVMACRAALQCQKYLAGINREWSERGMPALTTRIGLNTGEVIVGNFGYEERLNYTVMGDNVNLASRVEGLNKYYGTSIIISENTYARVSESFETRRIDTVAVKGKTKGVAVYELVAEKGDLPDAEKKSLDLFNTGSELYLNRQWSRASAVFKETLRTRPDDKPSQIMLRRCQGYMLNPPSDEWTGVLVMREK